MGSPSSPGAPQQLKRAQQVAVARTSSPMQTPGCLMRQPLMPWHVLRHLPSLVGWVGSVRLRGCCRRNGSDITPAEAHLAWITPGDGLEAPEA